MTIELTQQQIEAILQMINSSNIQGNSIEFFVELKQRITEALKTLQPKEVKS